MALAVAPALAACGSSSQGATSAPSSTTTSGHGGSGTGGATGSGGHTGTGGATGTGGSTGGGGSTHAGGAGGHGGSTHAGGAGGAGGTTTTPPPPTCDPKDSNYQAQAKCAAYVSSSKGSDVNGDGSPDKPWKTLGKALGSPVDGKVYACAEAFSETVTIAKGVTVLGGLDCGNGWVPKGVDARTEIDAAQPGDVALTVAQGVTGLSLEAMKIVALNTTNAGQSSIAVLVNDGAQVAFDRCEIVAGDAGAWVITSVFSTARIPSGPSAHVGGGPVGDRSLRRCAA